MKNFLNRIGFNPLPFSSKDKYKDYIMKDIEKINHERLKTIIILPILMSFGYFLISYINLEKLTGSAGLNALTIPFIRLCAYIFMLSMLVIKKKIRIINYIIVWFILIMIRSLIVDTPTIIIILILEVFLLNVFIIVPPKLALLFNSGIFLSIAVFRIFNLFGERALSYKIDGVSKDFSLIIFFISFFLLMLSISIFGYHVFRDMVRQLNLHRQTIDNLQIINNQKQELERMHRIRDDVERIVRHDMRAPLNGVIVSSELLCENNDPDEIITYASIIQQSGYKLLHMIDSSLDFYKMSEGTYKLKTENFDLLETIEETRKELATISRIKNIQIKFKTIPEESRLLFEGERLKISGMLSNLLKNALEASPRKETVSISVFTDNPNSIRMEIHNKGVVPEDIRDKFFERYATSGKEGGTGLGTYSVKLIVDAHGGSISFTTSDEEGTTLFVELPRLQS